MLISYIAKHGDEFASQTSNIDQVYYYEILLDNANDNLSIKI